MTLRACLLFLLLVALGLAGPRDGLARPAADSTLTAALEQLVTEDLPGYMAERDRVESALKRFYKRRGYRPAWTSADGAHDHATALLDALGRADRHGLVADDYRLDDLRQRLDAAGSGASADDLAALDARLSFAFLDHAADLFAGRIGPEAVDPEWYTGEKNQDFAELLADALDQSDLAGAFEEAAPQHAGYQRLRDALGRYREMAQTGGWPEIPTGDVVRPGDTSSRVPALRRRLAASGYLDGDTGSETYDDAVAAAVFHFQQDHGLATDSLLGPNTTEALNIPIEDRIRQIEMNLERWRWLPADLGERHVLVNIPAFKVYAYEDGAVAEEMNVVVGKAYGGRATPIFTDVMEHLIFSPFWNIPHSIATEEILPNARGNRDYLVSNNYEIVSHYGPGAEVYDPYSTSLARVASGELRLREKPGPSNALGLVKFMFPNSLAIYLHDTPADHLFGEAERDFSHGCVRVARPADLAEWVLSRKPDWDRARIDDAMHNGEWEQVELDDEIPVYLLYFTTFVEDDGTVRFVEDIYGHDDALDAAL